MKPQVLRTQENIHVKATAQSFLYELKEQACVSYGVPISVVMMYETGFGVTVPVYSVDHGEFVPRRIAEEQLAKMISRLEKRPVILEDADTGEIREFYEVL